MARAAGFDTKLAGAALVGIENDLHGFPIDRQRSGGQTAVQARSECT